MRNQMKELITITNDTALLNEETSLLIAEFERQAKEIKIQEEELKAEILDSFLILGRKRSVFSLLS